MFAKFAAIPAAVAIALSLAAPVEAATKVKEVEVTLDMKDIKNPEAARVWSNFSADLQNAIVARVAKNADPNGVRVWIDMRSIELANSLQQATGVADSQLAGRVNISSLSDNTKFDTYDLTVKFDSAYLPAGTDVTVLTIDSPIYYKAMVEIFADHVVEKLNA